MTLFLCVSKSQAMALTTSPVQQAQHPNPNREARRGRPGALGWKLGVQGSSLTSVTAAQCDLGQVTCPVCTSVCSPAKGAGWDGDLPLTLPPSCDSPASPVWFRTHHPPPTLPKAACLPHLPFQKERPSPFLSVRGGSLAGAGQPTGTGGAGTILAIQAARRQGALARSQSPRPRYRGAFVWGTQVCI